MVLTPVLTVLRQRCDDTPMEEILPESVALVWFPAFIRVSLRYIRCQALPLSVMMQDTSGDREDRVYKISFCHILGDFQETVGVRIFLPCRDAATLSALAAHDITAFNLGGTCELFSPSDDDLMDAPAIRARVPSEELCSQVQYLRMCSPQRRLALNSIPLYDCPCLETWPEPRWRTEHC